MDRPGQIKVSTHHQPCRHEIKNASLKLAISIIKSKACIYGSAYWQSGSLKMVGSNTMIKLHRLETQQKRAIRSITHSKYNEHTSPMFKSLNILKLKDIHEIELAKFAFMHQERSLPRPLLNIYNQNALVHSYNTRCN